MFLVLIEYIEDGGKEWSVVSRGEAGLRSIFPTVEAAEKYARESAAKQKNKFAVVEIKSWIQQQVQRTQVVETRVG